MATYPTNTMFLLRSLTVFICYLGALTVADPRNSMEYTLTEETSVGTEVGNLAKDAQLVSRYGYAVANTFTFQLMASKRKWDEYFMISKTTGVLKTKTRVDREALCPRQKDCILNLDVALQPLRYLTILKVAIRVLDINDNEPMFAQLQVRIGVSESALPGTVFTLPPASDLDSPANGVANYSIYPPSNLFDLKLSELPDGSTDVNLFLLKKLDRESQSAYEINVVAVDKGFPQKSGNVSVLVSVLDINDNKPKFDQNIYEVTIREDVPIQTTILRVHASDPDSGINGQATYNFSAHSHRSVAHLLGINWVTGDIYIKGSLDFEDTTNYALTLVASDKGVFSLRSHAKLVVRLSDVNDNPPQIMVNTFTGSPDPTVRENAVPPSFVAFLRVTDADQGLNAQFNCTLNDKHRFRMIPMNANEYKVETTSSFDRESQARYDLMVRCLDRGDPPRASTKHLAVSILDLNDNPPLCSGTVYYSRLAENNKPGAYITRINATDRDSGINAKLSFIFQRPVSQLQIDTNTGIITAKMKLDYEEIQMIEEQIVIADGGTPARTSTCTLVLSIDNVNDEAPHFLAPRYLFGWPENHAIGEVIGRVEARDNDTQPYNVVTYRLSGNDTNLFVVNPTTGEIFVTNTLDRERRAIYHLRVEATDNGKPPVRGKVNVTIYVLDKNDNSPIIQFPTTTRDTVVVSSSPRLGEEVTQVKAIDKDYGQNGRLKFSLIEQDEDNIFDINSHTGTIFAHRYERQWRDRTYRLVIKVEDGGKPIRSSVAVLYIYINASAIINGASPTNLLGNNLTTILSIIGGTGFVIVILTVAIIVFVVRKKRHNNQRYISQSQIWHMEGKCGKNDSSDPQVTSSECQIAAADDGDFDEKENPDHARTEMWLKHTNQMLDSQTSYHMGREKVQFASVVQGLVDSDADSACSVSVSNSDSGHGASEEGDVSLRLSRSQQADQRLLPVKHRHDGTIKLPEKQVQFDMAGTRRSIGGHTSQGIRVPVPMVHRPVHRQHRSAKKCAPPRVPNTYGGTNCVPSRVKAHVPGDSSTYASMGDNLALSVAPCNNEKVYFMKKMPHPVSVPQMTAARGSGAVTFDGQDESDVVAKPTDMLPTSWEPKYTANDTFV